MIANEVNAYRETLKLVCPNKDDKACYKKAHLVGLKCYSPFFIHLSTRAACFNEATATLTKDYMPQPQGAGAAAGPAVSSDEQVIGWTARVVPAIFTFDAQNYDTHMNSASQYFTRIGWVNFIDALRQSNLPLTVKEKNLKVRLTLDSTPVLISSGLQNGVQTWDVACPVTIRYDEADMGPLQPVKSNLALKIMRLTVPSNSAGVGIEQWLLLPEHSTPPQQVH